LSTAEISSRDVRRKLLAEKELTSREDPKWPVQQGFPRGALWKN
jgi:hypothetical protein